MKAAILHYAVPPVVGGVEMVIYHQARQFVHAGHSPRILAGRGASWDERIPVQILPLLDSRHPVILEMKASLDRGQVPASFEAITAQIQQELCAALQDCDLVIAHNVASLHKNLALTAALYRISQMRGPRMVLWHHDLAWTAPRYQAELHPGFPWGLLRSPWPGATQVVVSESRREELSQLMGISPETVRVIPNGVDLAAFLRLLPQTVELAHRLGLDRAAPILLTPVRLTRRKNLEQAVRILAALRERYPQAALVITGPPGAHNPTNAEYFAELQALRDCLGLAGAVHFLAEEQPNGLSDAEVVDLYHLADALLLTSREEGFGIPILEAGLARMPIFCTDLPPLRALAGEWGDFFSPDADSGAVAKIIAARLDGDAQYQMRRRVRLEYSWQAIFEQLIAPLMEAL